MQDFKGLANALQSGDLAGAQSAFSTLQSDLQNSQTKKSADLLDPNSQLGKDFKAIQDALSSGDLKSAQDAFATLKQDFRGTHRAHGHRQNRVDNDGDGDDGGSNSAVAATDSEGGSSPFTGGSSLNITA